MGVLTFILSAVLVVASAIYLYFKKKYTFFANEGVPHLEPSFPFGNIQGMGSKYHLCDLLMNLYKELKAKGPVVGFYNLAEPTYLATDLEVVKSVAVRNFNSFVNRGMYFNEKDEPLTAHLLTIEDDRWRFIRHKLSPALSSGKLKGMFSIVNDTGKKLVKTIERMSKNGTGMELKELMTRFTIDVVSSTTFGMDSNTLNDEHPELLEISREVFGKEGPSGIYMFFLFAFPNIAKFLGLKLFSNRISNFFFDAVGGNLKRREESNDKRNDFLNMLIDLKNKGAIEGEISKETRKLTLNECLAQAFVFYFAGTDTSSTTISFVLSELAVNQDIQDRLRKEIMEKTKDTNGEITYDNLHEMTYLNQVVSETLRMYTPGFAVVRQASEDFKVPNTNVTIRKGHKIWLPTLAFHYDEEFWPNPKKFDPERFTAEEIAKRPAQCYFPFGEGPRNCIGMRFGLINVKLAVAMAIKNFKVNTDPRMVYPYKFNPVGFLLEPVDGFLVKFEKI